MNTLAKNILFWLVIIVLALVAYHFLAGNTVTQTELPFSDFLSQAEAGKISEVTINGNDVDGTYVDKDASGQPRTFHTITPEYRKKLNAEYEKWAKVERPPYPDKVRFVTYTLKYASCNWVEVMGPIYPLGRQVLVNATSIVKVATPAKPYLTP